MGEHDHIHVFIQTSGLVVGESAEPDMEFVLLQTGDQSGESKLQTQALAQSFVHPGDP